MPTWCTNPPLPLATATGPLVTGPRQPMRCSPSYLLTRCQPDLPLPSATVPLATAPLATDRLAKPARMTQAADIRAEINFGFKEVSEDEESEDGQCTGCVTANTGDTGNGRIVLKR